MLEAAELALAFPDCTYVDEVVRTYETTMLPRFPDTAKIVEGGADHLLSADSPGEPR
ncbi:hypothetical protein [Kitasatospora sp. NPDC056184]|uniref:hypothetical protein n=1 Tax=Kitasatospora sp. NPDC056184 TaxID=3345738 RepID=UPI0035D97D04